MSHSYLTVTPLEGRATPSATKESQGSSCPPQDPMDNPPPVQPAPASPTVPKGGEGKSGGGSMTTAAAETVFSVVPTTATKATTKAAYDL
jgi:hypothetical protein